MLVISILIGVGAIGALLIGWAARPVSDERRRELARKDALRVTRWR